MPIADGMATPSGIFSVGFADFAYSETSSSIAEGFWVDPEKHLVGALFYPAEKGIDVSSFAQVRWLPKYGYATGFATFTIKSIHSTLSRLAVTCIKPLFSSLTHLLGYSKRLPAYYDAPIAVREDPFPVVLLSHGVGGNRMVQSCLCCELASQGFFVLSIEHADGTASAVRLKGQKQRWLYFQTHDHAKRLLQIEHRLKEVKTAVRLLQAVDSGQQVPGLLLSSNLMKSLKGNLDMHCVTTIGHSFGGGPACALPAEDTNVFKCGIGMDPYWQAVGEHHPVFHKFESKASVLMIGCQAWNDPTIIGGIKTDAEREKAVTEAAKRTNGGGGSIVMVIKKIGHASFTDAELFFGGIMDKLKVMSSEEEGLKPALTISLLNEIVLTFLKLHLPLTEAQRKVIDSNESRIVNELPNTLSQRDTSKLKTLIAAVDTSVMGEDIALKSNAEFAGRDTEDTRATTTEHPKDSPDSTRFGIPVCTADEAIFTNILPKDLTYSLRVSI